MLQTVAKRPAATYDACRTRPLTVRIVLPCSLDQRYELVAELGHGAHAIVYRAHDHELDRDVAVKVLRQELVDSDLSDRFRREIRLTSQLAHPHIAHVFGTGEWMGVPYFVTELAQGPSLEERLARERQLPVNDALEIGRQIAGALAHAHAKGIIHRDVKPANILLAPDAALLADFGVARALEAVPGTLATSTGVAVGTLLYMSPEQLCAEKDIDERSDQYELALVIYEMLAGVPPHMAANAEGLRSLRISAQHVPVDTHRPSVPLSVSDALMRAMAPSPADRFRNVTEFSKALELHDSGTHYRTTASRSIQGVPASGTPRRFAVIAGALLGVLGLGGVGLAMLRSQPGPARARVNGEVRSFAVTVRDDDGGESARIANVIAMELRAWPGLRADTGRVYGNQADATIEASVQAVRDGLQVSASLLRQRGDVAASVPVVMHVTRSDAIDSDSLALFAARLLMATVVPADSAVPIRAIRSRATDAVLAYARGWRSTLRGNLSAAADAFARAASDNALPEAHLWHALVRSWQLPLEVAGWRDAALSAARDSALLSPADLLIAKSLLARAENRMVDACAAAHGATTIEGGSFAAWYGLAECQRIDSAVVSDATSPTGVRFRTSHWTALRAYDEAITRLPSAALVDLFAGLPRAAFALSNTVRRGVAAEDSLVTYAALPRVSGDSTVIVPERLGAVPAVRALSVPASYQAALRVGRRRLLELSQHLARRAPSSIAAQLAVARALEVSGILTSGDGTASALNVLVALAERVGTRRDTMDIGIATLRVQLRLADFVGVRRTALNLLRLSAAATRSEAGLLAPVAVLVGDATTGESLLAQSAVASLADPNGLTPATARLYGAYTVGAALGQCNTLAARRTALVDALRNEVAPSELAAASETWVVGGDWMRLPCDGAPLPDAPVPGPLLSAYAALRAGDTTLARQRLNALDRMRLGVAASSIAWDTRFAEVALLHQTGNADGAAQRAGDAFSQLSATMDNVVYDVRQAGGFRRALISCDSLAAMTDRMPALRTCRSSLQALGVGR